MTLPRLPPPRCYARQRPLSDGCPRPPPAATPVFLPILVCRARPRPPHPSSSTTSTAPVLVRSASRYPRPFVIPARPVGRAQPQRPSAAPSHSARQLRPSAAPVDRARRPRPSAAPDLVPTTTRPPVHCVATRRCKIRSTFQNINKACMKNKTYRRPRSSAAPVDRARLPRPSTAPDLVPTTTRLPVHCVATRRRKIRSTFQNINEVCMKNKTYPRPANQRPLPLALRRPSRQSQTKNA